MGYYYCQRKHYNICLEYIILGTENDLSIIVCRLQTGREIVSCMAMFEWTTYLLQFRVTANFRLEIRVVDFSNSNNNCGGDGCDLYINYLCLDPLNDVCVKGSCSLDGDSRDLDLERGLPKTTSLTSESQPWPVSEVTLLWVYIRVNAWNFVSCVGWLSVRCGY